MPMALRRVAEVLDIISKSDNEEQAISQITEFVYAQLAESVDRNINFVNVLTGGKLTIDKDTGGVIATARNAVDLAQIELNRLKYIVERIKWNARESLTNRPDIPLSGSNGEFVLQNHGTKTWLAFEPEKRSFSNVITPQMVDSHSIGAQYLIHNTVFQLNKDFVEAELKAGNEIPWAKFEPTKSLQIKGAKCLKD